MRGRKNKKLKFLLVCGLLMFGLLMFFTPISEIYAEGGTVMSRIVGVGLDFVMTPVSWIFTLILWVCSMLLALADSILETSVQFSIVNFSDILSETNRAINLGWEVFRDLANMMFLFIILWIGISTILGVAQGNPTSNIIKILIGAILINFSMLFAKIIIDISNVIAIYFYDLALPLDPVTGKRSSIAGLFMESFQLQTLYAPVELDGKAKLESYKIAFTSIIGSGMILIATWVFLTAAVLLIIRSIYLIILVMLSPIAFVSWITPYFRNYTSKWWDALLKHALFAPIFMVMIYVLGFAIQNNALSLKSPPQGIAEIASSVVNNPGQPPVPGFGEIFFNFGIITGLLIAALVVSTKFSSFGGSSMVKWGKNLGLGLVGGIAGGVVGGAASKMEKAFGGDKLKDNIFSRRFISAPLKNLQDKKFFGAKSYKEAKEKGTMFRVGTKERLADLKDLQNDPQKMADYFENLNSATQKSLYTDELSSRSRASLYQEAKKRAENGNPALLDALEKHKGELSVKDREEADDEYKKAEDREKTRQRTSKVKAAAELFVNEEIANSFSDPEKRQKEITEEVPLTEEEILEIKTKLYRTKNRPLNADDSDIPKTKSVTKKIPKTVRETLSPEKIKEMLDKIYDPEEKKKFQEMLDKDLDTFFKEFKTDLAGLKGKKDVEKIADSVEKNPELIRFLDKVQLARLNDVDSSLSPKALEKIVEIINDSSKPYDHQEEHLKILKNSISGTNWPSSKTEKESEGEPTAGSGKIKPKQPIPRVISPRVTPGQTFNSKDILQESASMLKNSSMMNFNWEPKNQQTAEPKTDIKKEESEGESEKNNPNPASER